MAKVTYWQGSTIVSQIRGNRIITVAFEGTAEGGIELVAAKLDVDCEDIDYHVYADFIARLCADVETEWQMQAQINR